MNEKGAEREQTGIDETIREPQKRFSANYYTPRFSAGIDAAETLARAYWSGSWNW